ncbi:hypothetical protein B0T16DRAFT_493847 [Cercophora newfieldiana]|uniref:Fungal N-terminal domain-containing protein n=1 Tax=Cercophora newfieldiana TaxID=92897 RepID=A0AA39Y7T3_9PEZI|nr:hypothetical protein B0T16DRAFT_493847 [Cercophora newfieldiana]
MADPPIIVGAAASIASIIDIVGKTIRSIAQLRATWQETNLTVLTLESQLAALKAALGEIKVWIETHIDNDPHHQLVMDMDRCISCCRLLIEKIHFEVSEIQTSAGDKLDPSSKFRLLLKTKDIENIQRMIEQQTNVFILLLTACNLAATTDQKVLLERPHSRNIFRKMEDDTASLYVHRDVKLPKDELVRVRKRNKGGLFQAPEWRLVDSEDEHARKRNRDIDRSLKEDFELGRKEVKALVLGAESRADILRGIKWASQGGITQEERYMSREIVFTRIVGDAVGLMEEAISLTRDHSLWESVEQQVCLIRDYAMTPSPGAIDQDLFGAVSIVLESAWMQGLKAQGLTAEISEHAEALFALVDRLKIIALEDYLPTDSDIMYAQRSRTPGIHETSINTRKSCLRLYDISNRQVILLFANREEFATKLKQQPLRDFFPDFTGANEPAEAFDYILNRFCGLVQSEYKKLYSLFMHSDHEHTLRFLEAAISGSMKNTALKLLKLSG